MKALGPRFISLCIALNGIQKTKTIIKIINERPSILASTRKKPSAIVVIIKYLITRPKLRFFDYFCNGFISGGKGLFIAR